MAKAVLVMDMPDRCSNCLAYHCGAGYTNCQANNGKAMNEKAGKPDWCPLVILPDKMDTADDEEYCEPKSYIAGLHDGYNYFLDILEGKE